MERQELIDLLIDTLGTQKAWERNEALCAIVGAYDAMREGNGSAEVNDVGESREDEGDKLK